MDNSSDDTLDEGFDFRQPLSLFWHWSWLIALVAVVAGAAAYIVSKRMTPYYQSQTTVLVNEAPATQTTDYSSLMMSQQLTSTYSELMGKDTVLAEVQKQLGLTMTLEKLKNMITVAPVRDTQLIQITVETNNAQLSADIANSIASVFAGQIQDIQGARFAQSKASLEGQLKDIEAQIASYQAQAEAATTADEKESLETKVTQYREIYSNLLQSYESVRLSEAQSVSSVVQVETAMAATKPIRPKTMQNTLLAMVAGVLLAAGGVVAKEATDDTIKSPEEIGRKFGLPILGVINHHNGDEDPITLREPKSPTAEAYRTLRTNISYASVDKPLRTLMVTSPEPGEGKTTTLSNLAVAFAQNGMQVIVADCDLRHPRTHIAFRLNNRKGMSTLFAQNSYVLDGSCQPSGVENLSVVTTGNLPPNPAELLGSKKMHAILKTMVEHADVVLLDTPPTLAVADPAVLAPAMDGVLLVVRPGKTRASALKHTIEQMKQVGAKVIGIVLNDVSTHRTTYSYHYKYYRNYAAYQHYYGHHKKKR
jgi:succinoglycan biosynthesis transport protein ExoP